MRTETVVYSDKSFIKTTGYNSICASLPLQLSEGSCTTTSLQQHKHTQFRNNKLDVRMQNAFCLKNRLQFSSFSFRILGEAISVNYGLFFGHISFFHEISFRSFSYNKYMRKTTSIVRYKYPSETISSNKN